MWQSECTDMTQTEKWSLNIASPLCSEASTTYCADTTSNLQLVLSNERAALALPSRRAARRNEQPKQRERKRESAYFFGWKIFFILLYSYLYSQPSCCCNNLVFSLQILPFTEETWKFDWAIICLTLTQVCLSTLKESRDVYHPTPPSPHRPAHSHLLVFLPFAAVKIKLHIMVAITSLASWLLLTPNQLFCFLAMFIAIAGQIVLKMQNQIALCARKSIWLAPSVPCVDLNYGEMRTDGCVCVCVQM